MLNLNIFTLSIKDCQDNFYSEVDLYRINLIYRIERR